MSLTTESGGAAKRLTDPLLEPSHPDWSPKGDAVAFQSFKGGTFHIWLMKPDGTGVRQLTDGHGDDREPRFSPDGKKVAFSSDRGFKFNYDIWVADVDSGKLTQWTSSPADEFEPVRVGVDEDEFLERELVAESGHAVNEFGRVGRTTTHDGELHSGAS